MTDCRTGFYRLFCGYFDVDRAKHKLGFVRDGPNVIAHSYRAWLDAKVPLPLP